MADRTSARAFALFFALLAKDPSDDHRQLARDLWKELRDYDFTPDQMEEDEALEALGLMRLGVDPKHPQDGEVVMYGPL